MPNDAAASDEEIPNHMIVWLDQSIGNADAYIHLKMAFSSIADPKNETPVKLIDKDYDDLLRTTGPTSVNFEGVKILLAAFTNAERCVAFMQANQDKRIFFITSGQMGRPTVRSIMCNCPNLFTDPVTNEAYPFIYVFCHAIELNMDWIPEYNEYIQAFTFDADLLVRMIRDIAAYFVTDAKRLMEVDPPKYRAACDRLNGAYTLYDRYRTMQGVLLKTEFDEIGKLLKKAEDGQKSLSDDDD
jgi:hypothetical protein